MPYRNSEPQAPDTPAQLLCECTSAYPTVAAVALTAAALASSCGEEACGLFGELFGKLEVRTVPGVRVEDQPGIR